MKLRSLPLFLLLEAVATIVWWAMLAVVPSSRHWFFPQGWPMLAIYSCLVSDCLLMVVAGIVGAVGMRGRASWAAVVLWLHFGGVVYGTIMAVCAWLLTGQAVLGALLMLADFAVLCVLMALYFRRERTR